MSITTEPESSLEPGTIASTKRKRNDEVEELEIDVNAAEPPSKKQIRKAKKGKVISSGNPTDTNTNANDNSESKTGSQGRSKFGIWIGNLSFTTTKDDLLSFITGDSDHPIEKHQVTRVNLPNGPTRAGKPQNKGFAYIDFSDMITLNHALQLSESLFGGRRVLIKDATSFEGRPASKEDIAAGKTPSRRIFVGNLSFDTTAEVLEKHFEVCGKIQKVQIATFEDSGKCKGYAWIEFEQLPSAENAMRGWVELGSDQSGQQSKRRIWLKKIEGRQLRMEFAEDATTRYNKRYGKESKGKKQNDQADAEEQEAPIEEVDTKSQSTRRTKTAQEDPTKSKSRYGYEKSTVQRLKGAITESQGQKVVFD